MALGRSRIAFAVLGVIVIGLLAWTFLRSRVSTPAAGSFDGMPGPAAVRPEPRLPGPGAGAPRWPTPAMPPAVAIEPVEHVKARFGGYDVLFSRDPIDASWSVPSETALTEKLKEPGLQEVAGSPRDFAVACRGRLCRITAGFDTFEGALDWSDLYLANVGDTLGHVQKTVVRTDNGASVLIFGARPGAERLLGP